MKNSFILYQDQEDIFKKLTDDQAGKLIKAIFEYENTQIMPKLDLILDISITSIKSSLDRNRKKHNEISVRRAEAGSKGGKQKVANVANASNCYDSDSDSDSDKDTVLNLDMTKETTHCVASPHGVNVDQKNINKELNKKLTEDAKVVLNHLAEKSGHNYRLVESNLNLVRRLLKSGVKRSQICLVITLMSKKYVNTDKEYLLKPSVIFKPTNFEGYLGEFNLVEKPEEVKNGDV